MWLHQLNPTIYAWIQPILGWLFTYILHSTLFILLALALSSALRSERAKDIMWKGALLSGIFTTTLQVTFDFGLLTLRWDVASEANRLLPVELSTILAGTNGVFDPTGLIHLPTLFFEIWLIGLVIGILRQLMMRLDLWRSFRNRREVITPPLLAPLIESVLQRPLRLSQSPLITSPLVLNHREVCLPPAVLQTMPGAQQKMLLAHELAHIVRRDPFWLSLFSWMESLFFFQPLMTIGRKKWQLSAEMLCDQFALEQHNDPVSLAQCLSTVARWIKNPPPATLAALAGSPLRHRVERLLHKDLTLLQSDEAHTMRWLLLCAALILAVLSIAPTTRVSSSEPANVPIQSHTVSTREKSATGLDRDTQLDQSQPNSMAEPVNVPQANDSAWQSGASPSLLIKQYAESTSFGDSMTQPSQNQLPRTLPSTQP